MAKKLKLFITLLFTFLVFGLVIGGCGQGEKKGGTPQSSSKTQTVELKIGFYQPAGHFYIKTAEEILPKLEKLTEGRYKFSIYPGETICKATEQLDFTNRGICFGNFICNIYYTGSFPLFNVDTLPVWTNGPKGVEETYNGGLNQLIEQYLHEKGLNNVKYLGAAGFSGRALLTKKKQVRQITDLKGLKIRTLGFERLIVEKGGGASVNFPMPETYEALQRGVCDGVFAQETNWIEWKLYEQGEHLCFLDLTTSPMAMVVNAPQLEQIPQTDRQAVLQVLQEFSSAITKRQYDYDKKARDFLVNEWKKAYYLTDDEKKAFVKAIYGDAKQQYVKVAGTWGEKALEIVAKYNPPPTL